LREPFCADNRRKSVPARLFGAKEELQMKKLVIWGLTLILAAALGVTALAAEESHARAVVGADLTEEQLAAVYDSFGVERGAVPELTVTNAEERSYLSGMVDESVLGTRSISCVYIELLPEGSGVTVTTSNIAWCTREMYETALKTAGVEDARVVVAAPWEVSGTAALTGVFKAWEDLTGDSLSESAKAAGTRELVVTAQLADEISSAGALQIVEQLKGILDQTREMTDEQVKERLRAIAGEYHLSLTDGQLSQLVSLCRSLEKLDVQGLQDKVESVQKTVESVQKAAETLSGAREKARETVGVLRSFLERIAAFFSNLFNKVFQR